MVDIQHRLFTLLASGVTSVRELNQVPPEFVPMIRHLNSGRVPVPRILIAPLMREFETPGKVRPDSVAAYLARYKAMGYDYISAVYLPDPAFRPVMDSVVVVARRLGLPIGEHAPEQHARRRAFSANSRWADMKVSPVPTRWNFAVGEPVCEGVRCQFRGHLLTISKVEEIR